MFSEIKNTTFRMVLFLLIFCVYENKHSGNIQKYPHTVAWELESTYSIIFQNVLQNSDNIHKGGSQEVRVLPTVFHHLKPAVNIHFNIHTRFSYQMSTL